MSGNRLVIDSNIAIYLFKGNTTIENILNGKDVYLSFISEIELFSFKKNTVAEEIRIRRFISDCTLIGMNEDIKQSVISIRKKTQMRLPDCFIAATAMHVQATLFTADKNFKQLSELGLMLYTDF